MQNTTIANNKGTVMVPISVSSGEIDALLCGARIADEMECPLLLLHAVHEPANQPGLYRHIEPTDMHIPLDDVAGSICQRHLEELRNSHPHLSSLNRASLLIVPGLPSTRIVEVAKQESVSLIVMKGRMHSTLDRLLHGSISESVKKHAPCPVLTVTADGESLPDGLGSEIPYLAQARSLIGSSHAA